MKSGRDKKERRPLPVALGTLVVVTMVAEWILLVAGTRRDEMIVGALSLFACGAFLLVCHRSSGLDLKPSLADLAQGWRLPWYMLADVWIITVALVKDLLGLAPAGSFFRVSGFKTSKRDPHLEGRGVLATLYTTVTPNSIVLGIDPDQSRMLFHQLVRTPNSDMTRSLGAQQ